MLHGILFILKIIGILLLAVVGLIFAVMLLVLLVPVRYRLKASVLEKNPDVDVRITWLLHLLSVRVRYHPKGGPFDLAVRILGIRLGGRKKSTEDTEGDMKLRERNEEEDGNEDSDIEFGEEQLLELLEEGLENADSPSEETAEGTAEVPETSAKSEEETAEWSETAKADESHAEPNAEAEDWERLFAEDEAEAESFDMGEAFESEKETSSLADRIGKLIDKIRRVFQTIPEKIEKLKQSVEKLAEKKNSLMELIQDADNQSLFRLLWKQTGGVFRHIRPRKLRLYLHFGFQDPSLTGKLLGYASVFYAYYYKTVDLVPEFQTDKLILEGDLYARGRVRAGTLLCKGVRLLFNRGCRKLIKKVLKK